MAQICTAQFITDSGFATGLTPTVTINEALTGTLIGVFDMQETSAGNYVYNFNGDQEGVVYFFKYDAGNDNVVNRYEGGTNKLETTVGYISGGGTNYSVNEEKKKEKELIEKIANKVVELLPEQKIVTIDTKKIEEKLGTIESKIDESDVEFDYGVILSSQEKNTNVIVKKIENIKFPEHKPCDHSEVIKEIKNVYNKIDLEDIKENTKKIKTRKEIKEEEIVDRICESFEEELKEAIPEMMDSIMEDEEIFKSMME